jgi:hypothetical protein
LTAQVPQRHYLAFSLEKINFIAKVVIIVETEEVSYNTWLSKLDRPVGLLEPEPAVPAFGPVGT